MKLLKYFDHKFKTLIANIKKYWEFITSVVFFAILIAIPYNESLFNNFNEILGYIITIASLISAIILSYLISKVLQIRQEKLTLLNEVKDLTYKVNLFRNIINKLMYSQIWVNGLATAMGTIYKDLTFYEVKKSRKRNEKAYNEIAIKFMDDDRYGDTKFLYLELRTLLPKNIGSDETIYSEFELPLIYKLKTLTSWRNYNVGGNLYYFFDWKYSSFKDDIKLHNMHDEGAIEIKKLSLKINNDRYKDIEFGNILIAKLGTEFSEDLLPRLIRKQSIIEGRFPPIINYLLVILIIFLIAGVITPIFQLLYGINMQLLVINVSLVLCITFYIIISIKKHLLNEINILKH